MWFCYCFLCFLISALGCIESMQIKTQNGLKGSLIFIHSKPHEYKKQLRYMFVFLYYIFYLSIVYQDIEPISYGILLYISITILYVKGFDLDLYGCYIHLTGKQSCMSYHKILEDSLRYNNNGYNDVCHNIKYKNAVL